MNSEQYFVYFRKHPIREAETVRDYTKRIANIIEGVEFKNVNPNTIRKEWGRYKRQYVNTPTDIPNDTPEKEDEIANCDTIDEGPIIQGVTPQERVIFEEQILPQLKKIGDAAKAKNKLEDNSSITIPGNKPFALAVLSDIHGGGKTDYQAIENDINIIEETDDIYSVIAGDMTDNFVIGKLQSILKEQPTPLNYEQRFLKWFLHKIEKSLIAFVSGNHDNWTKKVSAYDHLKMLLKDTKCLFDNNQVHFKLKWGKDLEHEQKWMVRHKYKYSSIYNPTHGQEVFWERGGVDYDVSIGGHTHIATLCRPFIKHHKMRFAVLIGTYKIRDEFATEIGFARTYGRGSGAFVYHPDGRTPLWCNDLQTAKDMLNLYKLRQ